MPKYVKVTPLAAESLGVRSMCTYVETPAIRILLDAGVSLCPNRFGLPPHPREFKAIDECRKRIARMAEKVEVVTVSHYHFDHHTPSFEDWFTQWTQSADTARQIYEDKTVLVKNPKENINSSQRQRGWMFQKTSGKLAKELLIADGETFTYGKTTVKFSMPVFHGSENSPLGWVLMTTIEHETEKFMFAPDVQGPMSKKTLEIIVKENPQLIMLGGPPLYLAGLKVNDAEIKKATENLQILAKQAPAIILEHHVLRDQNWADALTQVFYVAYANDHNIVTSAEFLGQQNSLLEARRKELFAEDVVSERFKKWMRTREKTKRYTGPPI